jgi:transposase-like protein
MQSNVTAAVYELMRGGNMAEVAERLGITERTLRRWRARNDFQAALSAAQGEALRVAAAQLAGLADDAVKTLRQEVQNGGSSSARLRAAGLVLDNLAKMAELADFAERLDRLERSLSHETDTS